MIHRNVLRFAGGRYLWLSLGVAAGAGVLYRTQPSSAPRNGGTWQGYFLGTVGVALIVWLSLLAVRKRRYASTAGTLQGWASAHVYLGTALVVVATLHCGLQFGWNVHTLAYVLMCLVVASGLFGLYSYLHAPKAIAENREGGARTTLFAELFELDKQTKDVARGCAAPVHIAVESSIQRTAMGGGVVDQLFGRDRSYFIPTEAAPSTVHANKDQQEVIDFVAERLPRADKPEEAASLQQLVVLLCRRQAILRRLRLDIRLHGWLKVWLYFHTRVTALLLVALTVHIVVTFVYR